MLDLARNTAPTTAGLPPARGELSERLFSLLSEAPHDRGIGKADDLVAGASQDELQLCLYCCYELHYGGFDGVAAEWEWSPGLLGLRRLLEERTETELEGLAGKVPVETGDVVQELWEMRSSKKGRSLSAWLAEKGTLEHFSELTIHRSAYQLKEADPHTWAVPRLSGQAKATMFAIQYGEYGEGRAAEMHSVLFADSMEALGLDPRANAYLDLLPAATLLTTNLISLFGLHRRLRGALVGHLAFFEMTSTGPMSRYAEAMARLGLPERARRFYEVHVEADAVHEKLAADGLVGGFLEAEPGLAGQVLFGARALQAAEGAVAEQILSAWEAGQSSLRTTGCMQSRR